MRVVSWNVELGLNIDRAADALLEHQDLRGADVVLTQEMSVESSDRLAQRLGVTSMYDSAAPHPKTGQPFGNAIMSRHELRDPMHVLLPHVARVDGQPRSALFATVSIDGSDVLIGSVHIETVLLSLRRRVRQLQPIVDVVEGRAGPVVIGGDFNTASTRSRRAFERALAPSGLERLSGVDTETFRRFGRPFVLDHFFGQEVSVVKSGVTPIKQVSDHEPIWIELSD